MEKGFFELTPPSERYAHVGWTARQFTTPERLERNELYLAALFIKYFIWASCFVAAVLTVHFAVLPLQPISFFETQIPKWAARLGFTGAFAYFYAQALAWIIFLTAPVYILAYFLTTPKQARQIFKYDPNYRNLNSHLSPRRIWTFFHGLVAMGMVWLVSFNGHILLYQFSRGADPITKESVVALALSIVVTTWVDILMVICLYAGFLRSWGVIFNSK